MADGKVVFGSSDEHVYALDARTGALVWAYKAGGMLRASPARAGTLIVIGAWDSAVYALDATTGQLRWRQDVKGSWVPRTAAIGAKQLFVPSSDAGVLMALEKRAARVFSLWVLRPV